MNCRDIGKNLVLYFYDELDEAVASEVEDHLQSCSSCMESWDTLRTSLTNIKTDEPEMDTDFWNSFRSGVQERIDKRERRITFIPSLSLPVKTAVTVMILATLILGGYRMYDIRQQERFIAENYELLMEIEMLEDLELLQYLEETGKV